MKPGDLIYRVIRSKYDDKWYYCIYEVIRYNYYYAIKKAYLEIAPIITYYESKHSSHTTINMICSEEWKSVWRAPWDFISTDEFVAKEIFKEKVIENENQSNNQITSST